MISSVIPYLFSRAAVSLLLACVAVTPARAVVDGTIDANAVDSPWAGVGSISLGTGTYSGVLIAPHFVLTAAHVVGHHPAEDITFNLNLGGDVTHRLRAEAVYVDPAYRGVTGVRPGGEHDLAVIRLSEPAPAMAPVYGLYDDELMQGAVITFVGYGGGGLGAIGATEPPRPDVKRVGSNVIDCFAFTLDADNCDLPDLVGNGPRALFLFDFDPPQLARGRPGNGRLPIGEATLAGGDSGSPSFVYVQGQWRVAGINTFVTQMGPNGAKSVFGTAGGGVLVNGENGNWIRSIVEGDGPDAYPSEHLAPGVPEPRSWFLLALGLICLAAGLWRHWRKPLAASPEQLRRRS